MSIECTVKLGAHPCFHATLCFSPVGPCDLFAFGGILKDVECFDAGTVKLFDIFVFAPELEQDLFGHCGGEWS